MKKKTLGSHGRGKRRTVKYTDEYIEDVYEEDLTEQGDAAADTDSGDDEYIVAYSSERDAHEDYVSEQMQEYDESDGYEEQQDYDESENYEEQQDYDESESYDGSQEYDETSDYDEQQEYDESENYDESQEYDEAEDYEEQQDYDKLVNYEAEKGIDLSATVKIDIEIFDPAKEESLYSTGEIDMGLYVSDDDVEDTQNDHENEQEYLYEDGAVQYYASDEYFDDEYINEYANEYVSEEYAEETYYDDEYNDDDYIEEVYDSEVYDEDSFDIAYGDFADEYESDAVLFEDDGVEEPLDLWQRVKVHLGHLTAFDAVLASTGVVVLAAAFVILSMFLQSRQTNKQIEALAPLGVEIGRAHV